MRVAQPNVWVARTKCAPNPRGLVRCSIPRLNRHLPNEQRREWRDRGRGSVAPGVLPKEEPGTPPPPLGILQIGAADMAPIRPLNPG